MKEFTIVGYIAIDEIIIEEDSIHQLGGPHCFTASISKALGFPVKTVTRIGEDFPDEYTPALESLGIKVKKTPHIETTRFILDYRYNPRRMHLTTICEPINCEEIEKADRLVFCPIADEVNDQSIWMRRQNYSL